MAKRVGVPEFGRDAGRARVELERVANGSLGERLTTASSAAKEVGAGVGRTNLEISFQEPLAALVQGMPVRIAALEPPYPHLIAAHIRDFHEGGFAAAQPVAVHEIEQEEIANVLLRDLREEALHLLEREEFDW